MIRFRPVDRQTGYLLTPLVDDWLPEGHLAWFIVQVIDALDLNVFSGHRSGVDMLAGGTTYRGIRTSGGRTGYLWQAAIALAG